MYKLFLSIVVFAAVSLIVIGFRHPSPRQPSPGPGFALIELFTSEGCSSCPAADATLARVAREYPQNVYVLGYHVDYWDRLGWRDVYSSADYTNRQRGYAQQFNLNSIYTPEIVVNGQVEFVGSDESRLRSAIKDGLAGSPIGRLSLTAKCEDSKTIKVSYQISDAASPVPGAISHTAGAAGVSLQLALVQSEAVSQVLRGENQGRKLQHVNVVRTFQSIPLKAGTSGVADLKLPAGLSAKDGKIIGFLQEEGSGRIWQAARAEIL